MTSRVSSRFQITIPPEVRSMLKLSVDDPIEWQIRGSQVTIKPIEKPFLKYRGAVRVGPGSIKRDIRRARKIHAQRVLE